MNLDADEVRGRFAAAEVARLATADASGQPHLVPITFALHDDVIVTVVDHKPKRSMALRRLADIAVNPRVSLIVDYYANDWNLLWWARADGVARILDDGSAWHDAIDQLVAKYDQYRERRPVGQVILVEVRRWIGWACLGHAQPPGEPAGAPVAPTGRRVPPGLPVAPPGLPAVPGGTPGCTGLAY
ncbi:TIGR03668 family PPOX class F420-dependent oxidoreductase [Frankia sp. Cj5]|uniref:TIGR03668 family PPOX class F420-dependent oxidoreductase n=1 Tax=Frankia sp. Cj5 TaxID=2880978 RepID=UPI001EF6E4D2